MRPRLRSLANLPPPVWNPIEQRDSIMAWIAEFAGQCSLEAALTEYVNRCGYIPLCNTLGAVEVVRRWTAQHPDFVVTWDYVWSWALRFGTPVAKYHAITIALQIPSVRPAGSMSQLWNEVIDVLDVREDDGTTATSGSAWRLYTELASHFARYLEALHPGQDGERVACYAWWLADRVGRILGGTEQRVRRALEGVVVPEAQFSYLRWTVARSPVMPSALRYATVWTNSVWATSLVMQLSQAVGSLPLAEIPDELRDRVGALLGEHLLTCPVANQTETCESVFAFQQDLRIADLCGVGGLIASDKREMLTEVVRLRENIATRNGLQFRLERLLELPTYEQRLTLFFLREAVFSTYKFDDLVAKWLTQTDQAVDELQRLPESLSEIAVDALAEFQQRPSMEWAIRLPHLLAFVIERTDNSDCFNTLWTHAVLMSINVGIVSPIQRIVSSHWRTDVLNSLGVWRDNLTDVGKHSEPWVASRIRATSATILRLIGPRRREVPSRTSPTS